jgi:hypothetical protein
MCRCAPGPEWPFSLLEGAQSLRSWARWDHETRSFVLGDGGRVIMSEKKIGHRRTRTASLAYG